MTDPNKTIRVSVNGEWQEAPDESLTAVTLNTGHYLVTDGTRIHEVFSTGGRLSDGNVLDGIELEVESARDRIIRERFAGRLGGAEAANATSRMVKAPMPGLVRAIAVAVGDEVEKTTTVVVLEAMKMENNIAAGIKGRVQRIHVTSGNSVEKNAKLFEIEAA